jgi:hypothetical protein
VAVPLSEFPDLARNLINRTLREAMPSALDKVGGEQYFVELARTNPAVFCALLGPLIPNEARHHVEASLQVTVITGVPRGN